MTWSIEFHRLAVRELDATVAWYRQRSSKAADRFLDRLDQAIIRLQRDPESYAPLGRKYRQLRISRFPYLLVYQTRNDSSVFILAVAHTSRRPGYWRRRG